MLFQTWLTFYVKHKKYLDFFSPENEILWDPMLLAFIGEKVEIIQNIIFSVPSKKQSYSFEIK